MIPSVMAGGGFGLVRLRWQDRCPEKDDEDGRSADSSRCPSQNGSASGDDGNEAIARNGGRFPRSATMGIGHKERRQSQSRSGVEVVELKCEHNPEAALQDLLGLRVSGSRSVGVFVQSVHAGSVADLNGRIEPGDQLVSVGSISLLGLTPDQVVRVLRSSFSNSTLSLHITVAHQWADRSERIARPPSSYSLHRSAMSASRSEGAISSRSNNADSSHAEGGSTLLAAPRIGPGKGGMVSRRPSPPPRSPMPPPIPGVLSSTTPVEIHQLDKTPNRGVSRSPSRPHTQGAVKILRSRMSLSVDQPTTLTINCDETGKALEVEEESSPAINVTPNTVSPIGSASRFDSVLGMYDSNHAEKADTLSTLPPRPSVSSRKTAGDNIRRKVSLPFSGTLTEVGELPSLEMAGAQSIDRDSGTALPGSTIRASTLRHRRVSHQNSDVSSAGSGKTIDSGASRATGVTDLSRRFSPKLSSGQLRTWGSDDSLHLPVLEEEDRFNVGKPPRSLHADDIKHFITSAQRKSMRPMKEKPTNEELPLVSFDQLNQTSPSPTENNRRAIQSGSSGQSKSSKGSISSQGSQKLSWQCPVCLDGASRIRGTKRRMMSTACGHVFCSSCVEDVVGKYHMCPTCRMNIRSMKDVHPIFM